MTRMIKSLSFLIDDQLFCNNIFMKNKVNEDHLLPFEDLIRQSSARSYIHRQNKLVNRLLTQPANQIGILALKSSEKANMRNYLINNSADSSAQFFCRNYRRWNPSFNSYSKQKQKQKSQSKSTHIHKFITLSELDKLRSVISNSQKTQKCKTKIERSNNKQQRISYQSQQKLIHEKQRYLQIEKLKPITFRGKKNKLFYKHFAKVKKQKVNIINTISPLINKGTSCFKQTNNGWIVQNDHQ